ncbi:MAG: hypothetical protein GX825_06060 [Syntrophomonadaceae bacterium]|nr:hypothetical protein [Syntrophomonadaceae bacterium]
MSNSGSFFGWLITLGFLLTLSNYPVKAIYRSYISHLPTQSKSKRIYMRVQKFLVANHRYFALFTTVMLVLHILIQLLYRWFSWTGFVAALLMVANGFIGAYGHYVKKKRKSAWLIIHRLTAVLLILTIIAHLVSKGR